MSIEAFKKQLIAHSGNEYCGQGDSSYFVTEVELVNGETLEVKYPLCNEERYTSTKQRAINAVSQNKDDIQYVRKLVVNGGYWSYRKNGVPYLYPVEFIQDETQVFKF